MDKQSNIDLLVSTSVLLDFYQVLAKECLTNS